MRWMQTYSGRCFNYDNISMSSIDIRDIAHSLAYQCRFNGHCNAFYSVAEHSVRVQMLVEGADLKMQALLHDAAEAYIGDVIAPLKRVVPKIGEIEESIRFFIMKKFGVPTSLHTDVLHADLVILATEKRDLLAEPPPTPSWESLPRPLISKIKPWTPETAEKSFLDAFDYLRYIIDEKKENTWE